MSSCPLLPWRKVLLAAVCALALTACGRRGPLEAPPVAAAPVQGAAGQQAAAEAAEPEADPTGILAPNPTPLSRNQRRRGITVPKDPFILDPLL